MTDEEIRTNAESDPDTFILTADQRKRGLLGREVRLFRQGLGLTQEQFADRFGIAVGTLRDWEHGRRSPDTTARILLRIIVIDPDLVARVVQETQATTAGVAD